MSDKTSQMLPVVVQGVGHSGTTILYKLLCLHPDVGFFSQFSVRNGWIDKRKKLLPFDLYEKMTAKLIKHNWKKGEKKGLEQYLRYFVPRPGEVPTLWDEILFNEAFQEEDMGQFLKEIFEFQKRKLGRKVILFKYPKLYKKTVLLNRTLKDLKTIHVIRDGRANIIRRKKYARRDASPSERSIALEEKAHEWVNANSLIERKSKEYMLVRYEDLVEEVHTHLKRMFDFMGIDSARYDYGVIPEKLENTNKCGIPTEMKEKVLVIMRNKLEDYGYI